MAIIFPVLPVRTTDFTDALQTAIDTAIAKGKSTLRLLPRTYLIDPSSKPDWIALKVNAPLRIIGGPGVVLTCPQDTPGVMLGIYSDEVTIEGLRFERNLSLTYQQPEEVPLVRSHQRGFEAPLDGGCIWIGRGRRHLTIRDCSMSYCLYALQGGKARDVVCERIDVQVCKQATYLWECDDVVLREVNAYGGWDLGGWAGQGSGINVHANGQGRAGSPDGMDSVCRRVLLQNCSASYFKAAGIFLNSVVDSRIDNCSARVCGDIAIDIEWAKNSIMSNCHAEDSSCGYAWLFTLDNVEMINCSAKRCTAGVLMGGSSHSSVGQISINACRFEDLYGVGVFIERHNPEVHVTNCTFDNIHCSPQNRPEYYNYGPPWGDGLKYPIMGTAIEQPLEFAGHQGRPVPAPRAWAQSVCQQLHSGRGLRDHHCNSGQCPSRQRLPGGAPRYLANADVQPVR